LPKSTCDISSRPHRLALATLLVMVSAATFKLAVVSALALRFATARESFDTDVMGFAQIATSVSDSSTISAVKEEVRRQHKPGMVFVTQPWCVACDALKKSFNDDTGPMPDLLKEFVVVHHEGAPAKQWQVAPFHRPHKDDTYVPRIYFLGVDGEVLNQHGPVEDYPFFYKDSFAVLRSVVDVLQQHRDELDFLQMLPSHEDAAGPAGLVLHKAGSSGASFTDVLRTGPGSGVEPGEEAWGVPRWLLLLSGSGLIASTCIHMLRQSRPDFKSKAIV